ncbi:unnamed protein product [Caenorhabditis brenneri]
MLNFFIFYCPCHNGVVQFFDNENHKPYIGECKHIICEECVKKQEDKSCPFCQQKGAFVGKSPNYIGMDVLEDRRLNFWENLKEWWTGKGFDNGSCSSCDVSPVAYHICLTCNKNRLCTRTPEVRLKIKSNEDLLNLFGNVICIDCALENHEQHETIMIRRIRYAERDIKLAAANIILELFRRQLKDKKAAINCKLRHAQIKNVSGLSRLINELDRIDEGICGYYDEPVKIELINRYIINMDQKMKEIFYENSEEDQVCECIKLYEKVKQSGLDTNLDHIYEIMSSVDEEMFTPGCPLFFRTHSEKSKELYARIGEVPSEKVTLKPVDGRQCPLCVMLDHRNQTGKPEEFYVKNWMTIISEFWIEDKSRLENYCYRCLFYLKRYSVFQSCESFNLHYKETSAQCKHDTCLMKDPNCLKYVTNREFVSDILKIMKNGIEGTYFKCQLQKIRFQTLAQELFNAICRLSARGDTTHKFTELVEKVDIILESMKVQWNRLKNDEEASKTLFNIALNSMLQVEWMGSETIKRTICKCTNIWNKNEEMLKFETRDDEKKKYEDLKKSMTNMACFGLTREMTGCPIDFDHQIVLNEETLQKLSEQSQESAKSVPWALDEKVINSLFHGLGKLREEVSEMSWQIRHSRISMDELAEKVENLETTVKSSSISMNELARKVTSLEVLVMSSKENEKSTIISLFEKLNKVQEENNEMNRQLRFMRVSNIIILVSSLFLIKSHFF